MRRLDSLYGKKSYSIAGATLNDRSVFEKLECEMNERTPADHFGPRLLTTSSFTDHESRRLSTVVSSSISNLSRLAFMLPLNCSFQFSVVRLALNDVR